MILFYDLQITGVQGEGTNKIKRWRLWFSKLMLSNFWNIQLSDQISNPTATWNALLPLFRFFSTHIYNKFNINKFKMEINLRDLKLLCERHESIICAIRLGHNSEIICNKCSDSLPGITLARAHLLIN